nr:phosphoadenosine phosphosulfate reductase family protein [Brooklawnia cerclae]
MIDSPRLSPQDKRAWANLERYDTAFAKRADWPAKEARAHRVINEFAGAGVCYASTSWGKDSTCVAHLVATSGVVLPLVYVRMRIWESPECLLVRDAFLERYGHLVDYHEYFVDGGLRWWDNADIDRLQRKGSHVGSQFAEAERHHGSRHITGIRAEESRMRRIVVGQWGEAGPNACRPIARWTAIDVYAYLHRHDLPIHPAYAMSYGGKLDRRWLRVSPIGGISNAHKQRADWEAHYYPDIVRHTPDEIGGAR